MRLEIGMKANRSPPLSRCCCAFRSTAIGKFTSNYYGKAERHWGLVDADRDDAWGERTRYALDRSRMLACDCDAVREKARAFGVGCILGRTFGRFAPRSTRTTGASGCRSVASSTKAGAVNTPKLLLLSGVGPAADLQALGIAPLVDSPAVGRHLQDHFDVGLIYRTSVPTLNNQLYPWWGKTWAGMNYLLARRGPLALSLNQAGGFAHQQNPVELRGIQLGVIQRLPHTRNRLIQQRPH